MLVSAIQYRPRMAFCRADVTDNLRKCEGLLNTAARMGSQLVVLPELFATGYSFLRPEEAYGVAEEAGSGPVSRFMRGAATGMKSYLAWGFVELLDGRLYNSVSISDPSGAVVLTSQKMNLWGNDYLWARPGRNPPKIVQSELGSLSAIVCRDVRDKIPGNLPRMAVKDPPMFSGQKVDVVAMCLNWGKGGFPSTAWMDFVADNQCLAVIANRWGEERNGTFSQDFGHGGSAIVEADWTVHTDGLEFGANCVVSAHV